MKKDSNNYLIKAKDELSELLNKIPENFSSWDYIKTVNYKKTVNKALKSYKSNNLEKIKESYLELSGFY